MYTGGKLCTREANCEADPDALAMLGNQAKPGKLCTREANCVHGRQTVRLIPKASDALASVRLLLFDKSMSLTAGLFDTAAYGNNSYAGRICSLRC